MTSFTIPVGPTSSVNLQTSLLGIADPVKFVDPIRPESQVQEVGIFEKYGGRVATGTRHGLKYTIIIILISAIIFVTAVALYDVVRHLINNYYAKQVLLNIENSDLQNQNNQNQENEIRSIQRTLAANQGTFIASLVFAAFCILIAILLIPLLLMFLQ